MNAKQNVLEAVQTENIVSKQGILQKIFAVWFDAFVYNQIWEDPQVDLKALQLDKNSRILTISSGGCNVLNYLIENPESITAVDLNRYHIHLLRLKIASVKFLPAFEDFFYFYGFGKHSENTEKYRKFIASKLEDETAEFWESNGFFGNLLHGKRIMYFSKGGLYNHSRNAYFLRFFHRFANILGCYPEEILSAETLEEQEKLFEKNIAPFFDSRLIKILGQLPITMFGLGIPPQQYEELKRDLKGKQTIIDIYRERAKKLACGFSIRENYFAWQALARKYDTKNLRAVPEYLKPENFHKLKENAYKINTEILSVTEKIRQSPPETFNRFVFLDAQDWMDKKALNELWAAIAAKAEKGSRIIFRTAGKISPIEQLLEENLSGKFKYEKDFSAELFKQDRSAIYGGFHLYILK